MRIFWTKLFGFYFLGKKENCVCVRFYSKLSGSDPFVEKDPFKRKTYNPFKKEVESRNASRICITVLGNGGIGQPQCLGLFTEFKGYLFNCGEGVGRYCREYNINTCCIKHVFITQKKWENICGLSDIYVANKTFGLYQMSLYGPPGVEQFLYMNSSKELDTRILKKEGGYIDHTVDIDYIPVTCQKKKLSLSSFGKENHYFKNEPDAYSYACKIFKRPGDFLIEKCIEYGVPIGPDLLKLKNWENIVLPPGKIVYAEDVHGLSYPERMILIVDCPSESFLESFINEKKFVKYQTPLNSSPEVLVFHFTPAHIFNSQKYQGWMNRFHKNTEHFVLNSDNSSFSSVVIHQTAKYFNLLHTEIFHELRDKELICKEKSFMSDKLIYPPQMMMIYLRPKKEFNLSNVAKDEDNVNIAIDGTDIVRSSSKFFEKLDNLKSFLHKSTSKVNKSIYPEVVFLGTSSAASTAYRNVSAILLNISSNNSILLDCGEGTMMQFVRYFGSDVSLALQKISCIFVSHKHLDHYMGLFHLISQRIKAFENAGIPYKPVAVILPFKIEYILKNFSEAFENLLPAVKVFNCQYFKRKRDKLKNYIGDIKLFTVPVKHCEDAWGIVIESESQWKIVYSGDTAPCQALIDAGKDCTLLIHEATIDDGMLLEALAKKHSTPSQVIDIAEKMNAQHIIMTHFSKRYLGFPVLPENSSMEIACAFDFMKVRMCDLPLLPFFVPVIKCLFEGHLESYTEKAFSSLSFENVFLKVLKS